MTKQATNKAIKQQALDNAVAYAQKDKDFVALGAGVQSVNFYSYTDIDGNELYIKIRLNTDKGKWIKPFYFDGERYKMGLPKLTPKPLYNLPRLLSSDVVYIVEGEKCADYLNTLGLVATTFGSATSFKDVDFTPLQGKQCVLWCDNDDSGYQWLAKLQTALDKLAIAYDVIDVYGIMLSNGQALPIKGDCADFIDDHLKDGQDYQGVADLIARLPLLDMTKVIDQASLNDSLAQRKAHLQQEIARLSELDDMELCLSLRAVASEFGITKDKLSQLVYEYKQGDFITDPTPYQEPIAGVALFDELYALADNHIIMSHELKTAFALWVLFTYLTDISDFAPIAWITAADKSCGKSTLLGLFERVVCRPYNMTDPTAAVIYRIVEKFKPCLLIDEIDTGLKDKNTILGIINAGYSRHACKVGRVNNDKGGIVEAFNAFGAKVLCGIGNLQGTTASRTIKFALKRKAKSETVKRTNQATLPYATTELIRQKCKRWCDDNRQAVQAVGIEPLDVADRDFDNWYILLQIASVLGVYDKAMQACLALCQAKDELSQNEQLLSDIRDIWQGDKMALKFLCEKLNADDEKQWQTYNNGQEITVHQLSKKLRAFGINSKTIKTGVTTTAKGYDKTQFITIWERYLPPPTEQQNPFLLP